MEGPALYAYALVVVRDDRWVICDSVPSCGACSIVVDRRSETGSHLPTMCTPFPGHSTGKFLLVQEFGASGWWLPGGRIDPGEDFARAAVRECQEEAGVLVELTGVRG